MATAYAEVRPGTTAFLNRMDRARGRAARLTEEADILARCSAPRGQVAAARRRAEAAQREAGELLARADEDFFLRAGTA